MLFGGCPIHFRHVFPIDQVIDKRLEVVGATKDQPELQRGPLRFVRAYNSSAVKVQWICG